MKINNRKASPLQKKRIREAVEILKNYSADPDCLFRLVAMLGPSFIACILSTNAQTVWARVEKPFSFKYEEMKKISEALKFPVTEFIQVIEIQAAHNRKELIKRRLIGHKKYNRPYCLSRE